MLQESGFPAIATSSAAVANSLGYEDGENMSFSDYLFVIRRMLQSINVPLTVDIETGYGENDEAIADNIFVLAGLGVAGINIEDSAIGKTGRTLKNPEAFSNSVSHIKAKLQSKNLKLFINVRCDTHILNVPSKQQETIKRIKVYNTSGADGIFVPCISNEQDITEVLSHTQLPLNVMCIPGLPGLDKLRELGVKRVSMGPFMFKKVYENIHKLSKAIISTRTFSPLLT